MQARDGLAFPRRLPGEAFRVGSDARSPMFRSWKAVSLSVVLAGCRAKLPTRCRSTRRHCLLHRACTGRVQRFHHHGLPRCPPKKVHRQPQAACNAHRPRGQELRLSKAEECINQVSAGYGTRSSRRTRSRPTPKLAPCSSRNGRQGIVLRRRRGLHASDGLRCVLSPLRRPRGFGGRERRCQVPSRRKGRLVRERGRHLYRGLPLRPLEAHADVNGGLGEACSSGCRAKKR